MIRNIILLIFLIVSMSLGHSEYNKTILDYTHLPNHVRAGLDEYIEIIIEASYDYKINPYLLIAIMWTESDFRHLSKSHTGDIGLMQINPNTKKWICSTLDKGLCIKNDPRSNVRLGAIYLQYLKKRFNGNLQKVIVAYNKGPNHKYLTKNKYYDKVMKRYKILHRNIYVKNI